ncbi:MAG: type IV pilus assembly protein PilM [Candidatus Sungbacteria bacterium]|nr:type IV pilus assembly protein PilM [Candidatus Sungbacteria bacterium]
MRYNIRMPIDFSFLKRIGKPNLSLFFLKSKPSSVIGINIGAYSTKVVQLRYASERAVLETYGELLNEGYLKHADSSRGAGILHFTDADLGTLVTDVIRESNVTTRDAVATIPAASAFITTIAFPRALEREIPDAVPYEARKYVPIPLAEVVLEWMILEDTQVRDEITVLLVAVAREVVEKFRRVAELANLNLRSLEVEPFSMVRSLIGYDNTPTLIINFGHQSTTLVFADRGLIRMAHTLGRGSQELTRALERGLAVSAERAETLKREVGLSERIEEREITAIMIPMLETLFADIGRMVSLYHRTSPRRIQKVNLTGGGANLKGIVEFAASKLGIEVTRGNPFARTVTPAFLQTILKDIGPTFSAASGAAMRELTPR